MNPILLKPDSKTGSQVIVNGRPIGSMPVTQYVKYKSSALILSNKAMILWPDSSMQLYSRAPAVLRRLI